MMTWGKAPRQGTQPLRIPALFLSRTQTERLELEGPRGAQRPEVHQQDWTHLEPSLSVPQVVRGFGRNGVRVSFD